jgi:hypothetical protein
MDKHFRVRKQVTAAMLYKRLTQKQNLEVPMTKRGFGGRHRLFQSLCQNMCLLTIRKRDDEIGLLLWRELHWPRPKRAQEALSRVTKVAAQIHTDEMMRKPRATMMS